MLYNLYRLACIQGRPVPGMVKTPQLDRWGGDQRTAQVMANITQVPVPHAPLFMRHIHNLLLRFSRNRLASSTIRTDYLFIAVQNRLQAL